jgi:hypothetical protein
MEKIKALQEKIDTLGNIEPSILNASKVTAAAQAVLVEAAAVLVDITKRLAVIEQYTGVSGDE